MTILLIGLVIFLGIHSLPILAGLRSRIRDSLGEQAYKGLYSLVSIAGFILIIWGYGMARADGSPLIWDPPHWMRHLVMLLMLPVFVLLAASNMPGRIRAATKHPMLVAVKLWALSHLLVNGDLAGMVLFGAFLAWAVLDRISMKYRSDNKTPAIGANAMRNDVIAVVAGLALYVAFVFWLHPWLIGVPVVG